MIENMGSHELSTEFLKMRNVIWNDCQVFAAKSLTIQAVIGCL